MTMFSALGSVLSVLTYKRTPSNLDKSILVDIHTLVHQYDFTDLHSAEIKRYIELSHGLGSANQTITRNTNALRGVHKLSLDANGVEERWGEISTAGFGYPKSPSPHLIGYEPEIRRVLKNFPSSSVAGRVMYNAVFETLMCSGMRHSELLSLRLSDFDFNKGTVSWFAPKTKTQCRADISKELSKALQNWMRFRGNWKGYMFGPVRKDGHIIQSEWLNPMSGQALTKHFRVLKELAGLPDNATLHSFRKTRLQAALSNGTIHQGSKDVGHARAGSSIDNYTSPISIKSEKDRRGSSVVVSTSGRQIRLPETKHA